jgi:multiple sugar transport system substrate-binding protein
MKSLKEFIEDQRSHPPFIADDERDECSLLLNQKASMVLTTYDRLHMLGDAPFAYDIAPIPYLKESRTLLHVISLGVSKKSKNKQVAQAFIRHILSYESQKKIRDHTLRIPALKQAAADDFAETSLYSNLPKHYTMYRDIIPTYRYYSDLNMPLEDLIVLYNELKFYWSGMDDLETVLRRLEEKLGSVGSKL